MNGMALYNFHRVLISTAALFFLAFSIYAGMHYVDNGSATNLIMAVVSGLVGVGALAYLFYFNARLRRLSEELTQR
ncbi:MAG: hypothetical protein K8S99_04875 [Planctomycetes bacterium]|nr:hypothetical protein [Planctomycetota bacterium]